jgi:hypothetical protein
MGIVKGDSRSDERDVNPCHQGAMNGGCVVMGIPHPSHPFMEPHPTVYETAWEA